MRIFYQTGSLIQRLAWLPLGGLFSLFLRREVHGKGHVTRLPTNAIFAANHAHDLDPLILVSCLPFFSHHLPLVYVVREKDFYRKLGWRGRIYGGLGFKLMAALPAYTGQNDYGRALRHHRTALKAGRSVGIFPVGRKHGDEDIDAARGGVAYLAAVSGRPIVPVRITGITQMTGRDWWRRRRKLRVTFGKPIYFSELAGSDTRNPDSATCERAAVALLEYIVTLDSHNGSVPGAEHNVIRNEVRHPTENERRHT